MVNGNQAVVNYNSSTPQTSALVQGGPNSGSTATVINDADVQAALSLLKSLPGSRKGGESAFLLELENALLATSELYNKLVLMDPTKLTDGMSELKRLYEGLAGRMSELRGQLITRAFNDHASRYDELAMLPKEDLTDAMLRFLRLYRELLGQQSQFATTISFSNTLIKIKELNAAADKIHDAGQNTLTGELTNSCFGVGASAFGCASTFKGVCQGAEGAKKVTQAETARGQANQEIGRLKQQEAAGGSDSKNQGSAVTQKEPCGLNEQHEKLEAAAALHDAGTNDIKSGESYKICGKIVERSLETIGACTSAAKRFESSECEVDKRRHEADSAAYEAREKAADKLYEHLMDCLRTSASDLKDTLESGNQVFRSVTTMA